MHEDTESPWPKRGAKVLAHGRNSWYNASLKPDATNWWVYAEGYARGAAILVQHVVAENRDQDFVVYPIVFLYRHHLELALKDLIQRASELLGRPSPALGGHHLDVLWKTAKPLLKALWPNGNEDVLTAVEEGIGEFAAIDGGSIAFRYPSAKDGSPTLPPDLTHINISNLGHVMAGMVAFLSACRLQIGDWQEQKDDLEREMRLQYGDDTRFEA